ncbi:MAG: T9SS type A sorting domain-containing protein [Paludibacter sp.]
MRYKSFILLSSIFTCLANLTVAFAQSKITSETRDPLLWPFAATSIWNTAIGSNANYVPANLEMPTQKMLTLDEDLIVLTPDMPNMNINWCSVRWGTGDRCTPNQPLQLQGSVPIPQSFVVSPSTWDGTTPNAGIAVLLKDKHSIWQSQPFAHCSNGSDATTGYVYADNQDLYGNGYYGSHGGSRLSVLGGSIRNHELTKTSGPIRHAIKMNLCGKKNLYYDAVNKGFRWPALAADAAASTNYGSLRTTPAQPECRMGALMAIPATVTIASLGLESEPGRILAQALQDYGGYVVDDTGWDVFAIETEWGPNGRFRDIFKTNWGYDFVVSMSQSTSTNWGRDIVKIYKALNIVTNNSADNIGGGGTRRQPLAPAFITTLTQEITSEITQKIVTPDTGGFKMLESGDIRVISSLGQIVKSERVESEQFVHLNKGVYLIQLQLNKRVLVQKVIL